MKAMHKRRRIELHVSNKSILKEYCDILISQIKDKLQFTGHLAEASLFYPDMFWTYKKTFPQDIFDKKISGYPFINSVKLKSKLMVVYNRDSIQ